MWRETAERAADKVLTHLGNFDRQHPEFLASVAGVVLNSIDWHDVLSALHRLTREQEVPLTYAPDLNVWTVRPIPGDAMANAVWDLRNARRRLSNCGQDAEIASKSFSKPAIRVVLAHIQGTADSVVAALDSQIDILDVAVKKQREMERAEGLI